ncbi:MAG: hypothetical protein ACR2GR_10745 [Rhodothermales bacterium]
MDANLHQKQGINHLTKVLTYAPFVAEEGRATVHLTPEDWHVVADTLFQMETPKELLPKAIESYELKSDNSIIELKTADYLIDVDTI